MGRKGPFFALFLGFFGFLKLDGQEGALFLGHFGGPEIGHFDPISGHGGDPPTAL